ncbi:methyltransferase-like protein 13 [Cimex lectularius]|uniref:Methyltransferase domain-containing protein n=1 Tax=Cimex lectularius TaxID=79782 RepID=A0A8I6S4W8_CIMLE|nr:methyltransferase-like protein 13 [Cimex lectularius]
MSLLPKSSFEFSKAEYWEAFYKQRDKREFEWYGEYPELSTYLHKYMKTKEKVLVVGCGNSKLSADLYDVGYKTIHNIDISKTAIMHMKIANYLDRPNLVFEEMDALNMTFENENFNVVLDKGTLDALMPDENSTTYENITKYFDEVDRVLRFGGRYIIISLLQEHVLAFLLKHFIDKCWMIRVCRCYDVENKSAIEQGIKPLPVFMVVCTKFKKMPGSQSILELCPTPDSAARRVSCPEKIIDSVVESQQVAIVCAGLQRSTTSGREIVLEVGKGDDEIARYILHIVDRNVTEPNKNIKLSYGAFIVPLGREAEWVFGTPEGRQYLVSEAGVTRLAVITLNRGHEFTSMESIKAELAPIVADFAPSNYKKKIVFLSVGGDVGVRNEVFVGESPISGKYIVEETQVNNNTTVRRLYFMAAKNIIQSEAKIRKVKTRRGNERVLVDTCSLSCTHHSFMCVGACSAVEANSESQILVIGLGGGSLCSYLRRCFPRSCITAVELDPDMLEVATSYFGLKEDKQLIVYIKDGLQFIKEVAERGAKYDVLMFDVDNKTIQTGLSCPPASFVEMEVLQRVKKILNPQGVFILNLVCRDTTISADIYKRVQSVFGTVGSVKLDDDLNEIIYCYSKPKLDIKQCLEKGSEKFADIIQHKKLEKIDCIELEKMLNLLNLGKKK